MCSLLHVCVSPLDLQQYALPPAHTHGHVTRRVNAYKHVCVCARDMPVGQGMAQARIHVCCAVLHSAALWVRASVRACALSPYLWDIA
jgi:hypothetical protein